MQARFSPRSERDLEEIGDYVATRSPKAAARYVRALRIKCQSVAQIAKGYPAAGFGPPTLKRANLGDYAIFFQTEGRGVRIERILHGARDLPALFDEN